VFPDPTLLLTYTSARASPVLMQAKKLAARLKQGEIAGYTDQENPFGDANLTERFVWHKKIERSLINGRAGRASSTAAPFSPKRKPSQPSHPYQLRQMRQLQELWQLASSRLVPIWYLQEAPVERRLQPRR
jgi:hypothetical protein